MKLILWQEFQSKDIKWFEVKNGSSEDWMIQRLKAETDSLNTCWGNLWPRYYQVDDLFFYDMDSAINYIETGEYFESDTFEFV